jgi:hypothetical protein
MNQSGAVDRKPSGQDGEAEQDLPRGGSGEVEVVVHVQLVSAGHNSMTSVDTLSAAGLGSTRRTGEVYLLGAFRS